MVDVVLEPLGNRHSPQARVGPNRLQRFGRTDLFDQIAELGRRGTSSKEVDV